MTNMTARRVIPAALALAVGLAAAADSQAKPLGRVTAQSDYGHGSVTGAVRIGPSGHREVQLPSGFWEDCAGDCRETLRRKSIDYWRAIDEEAPDGSGDIR